MDIKYQHFAKTSLYFAISFFFSMALLIPFTPSHYQNLTQDTSKLVETQLEGIQSRFDRFLSGITPDQSCDVIVRQMRQTVFDADWVKEAAVFDKQNQFYCSTTDGEVSFRLYSTIRQRLNDDPNLTTLSYSNSAITQVQSIMLIFSNKENAGVSLMIPPHFIYDIVETNLNSHGIQAKVEVIKRDIHPTNIDSSLAKVRIQSNIYPLTITSYIGYQYYLHFMLSYLWFGFLMAGITTIILLSVKHKKQSQRSLEYSLSSALKNKHLHVHMQPIVNQNTNEIVGCESLLRWNDPIEGNVSPAIFIPLAESLGLIEELTYFVLRKVLMTLKSNQDVFESKYISVNISRNVVSNSNFSNKVISIFKRHPEILKQVVFEVTEDGECSDADMVKIRDNLTKLSNMGVRVAIDDFGTGYAGLDFVRQFPFSILKIDRVFVKNISDESIFGLPLLESMLQLSRTLGMQVIVEGVEYESQVKILSKLGVDYIQGFYFYKPMPINLTLSLLKQQHFESDSIEKPSASTPECEQI
ncbi:MULTISPECIES: EAL domain-containing protein [unclassified Vibrio]|uniref:EAL domain-containing protein n=1 Tax=unclassified Vibrio TaxID=2614977 RepID=UPI000C85491E|nr:MULTISPECIES: EAL domain-containing protein [unclassified Vibrio]PMI20666.1 diguanylate phosphodiesterase [Vibrio sp. 10N.286.46.E10]PMI90076.1 diguanylate phosphodiesterase [Vibrio sp. 10N.286.45.E10]PTP06498.1 EAL domain-containing protein [Vibrio sp. 10N.286.45.A3]PTP15155.1 EAL domain-containing protein [Vibrio sp. 10N.286.51.C3]PTQ22244.1 EAL domain-containing protein [Vibrio sp. 10N.286.46.E10]